MAREINRRHIIAVVREIAGLQGPYRVVHAGAMQKHHHRLPRDPGSAAGGGENRFAVNRHLHRLCSPGGGFEGLGQIARQIVDIFQTHRQAHQILGQTDALHGRRVHLLMGRAGRVNDQ